ncbi:RNA polymerase sigma-70 factor, ECF subfamily [Nakamurella panacisegetis]|uniref:RNA polymerase sigma-70 factor, ECF subfamily n=1 Tax=Nakamurella panacisegetis TaxID=1090615 RepID=A0A1H0S172_9ACTN|nr:RNA polymerase sigma-70 factor, ECF subfamily [Nakamurella panacisegetis]
MVSPGGDTQHDAVPDRVDQSAETLLLRVATGDRAAFSVLYGYFAARVFGLANRILRDPSHAEEVAQEIFLEIWQRAPRFDRSRGTAASWIMTITHGRSVDRVRHAQASRARDLRTTIANFDRDVDSVADSVIQEAEAAEVRECLDTLTPLQRESITLAYFGGHTQREVGELLGAALPTIKTRMRDGLIRMRDCLSVPA